MSIAATAYAMLRSVDVKLTEFRTRITDVKQDGIPVQHAVDAKGLPALLVPLSAGEPEITDSASKGIGLSTHHLSYEGEQVRFLVVRCLDAPLERQFCLLADDMLDQLGRHDRAPGIECLFVLSRWRGLFEPSSTELLGLAAQAGLLAELHMLESLVTTSPASALETWVGPVSARHDFVTTENSVEVKATMARNTLAIAIHGATQLDSPATGRLWIYAEQMEATPSGDSLPAAVDRLVGLVSDKASLLHKLEMSGFRLEDSEAYLLTTFSVVRTRLCLVDESFPRIVRSTLADPTSMDRIVRLDYSIDLGPVFSAVADDQALKTAIGLLA